MKSKIGIFAVVFVLLLSSLVFAQNIPVKVTKPVIKNLAQTKILNGKIEPYKSVRISSEISGTANKVNIEVGQKVKRDQPLIVFDQDRLQAQVKQAEAAVELAKASLDKVQNGATEEEIAQVEAAYQRAQASFEGAQKSLKIIKSIYNDKTSQKQQLTSADTQLESAKKQLEIAEERYTQAKIAYNQANTDYQRMKSLYKVGAITEKEFEGVETQYKNSKSALKTAQLGKEQAQINYNGALKNYKIAQDVFKDPQALEQQLDNAKTQVEVARAGVKTAKANLDKVKKGAREEDLRSSNANLKQAKASLELAKIQLENSVVKSPAPGIVSAVNVEEGEMVGAGTPVVNIVELNQVYVDVNVNADTLSNINVGDQVNVDVLPFNDGLRQGKIDTISPVIDQQAQAYPVKVLLNNKDNKLRGGMFADVSFVLDRAQNAVVVPLEAVVDLDGNPYVFVVEDGKAVKKDVKVGIVNSDEIEVKEGISKNDSIVIQGQSSLHDGDLVEVVG